LLYRWDHLVLSIGPSRLLGAHSHGAAELRISMDAPISCRVGESREIEASSILIPPGVRHQNCCEDPMSSVLYLDVESQDYAHLIGRMSHEDPIYTGLTNLLQARKALGQIIRSVPGLDEGHNLTTAAHDAGFADSAHFTRTFVKMYGAPPSRLLSQHRQSYA